MERKDAPVKVRRDVAKCHGCRACEIMCSFHQKGCIAPALSSITVTRDNAGGQVLWSVDETCDACRAEAEPLCRKYCLYGAIEVGQ
jgi:Fe-S-cluster-containing dehydrogenase component